MSGCDLCISESRQCQDGADAQYMQYLSKLLILLLLLTLGTHARGGLQYLSCVCVSVCPFSLFCFVAVLGIQREVSAATGQKMQ